MSGEHARLGIMPTAADLLDAPERAMELDPSAAVSMLAAVEGLAAVLRIAAAVGPRTGERPSAAPDEMLTAKQAAQRTGMSTRWLYKHARELRFARRNGRSVRFSARGIEQWLAKKKG